MPSYVIHLSCARRILDLTGNPYTEQEKNLFYLGNIIADLCREKRRTHFWDAQTFRMLARRPNLEWFLRLYGEYLYEPFVRGYYSHLYLDRMFLDTYWAKHFRFFDSEGKPEDRYDEVSYVEVVEHGQRYDRQAFFSKALYYGDYDTMNSYFARKYQPGFPKLTPAEMGQDEVRRIAETDWAYAPKALADAEQLFIRSLRQTGDGQHTELKVFCIDELEDMIEQTAKKLADV